MDLLWGNLPGFRLTPIQLARDFVRAYPAHVCFPLVRFDSIVLARPGRRCRWLSNLLATGRPRTRNRTRKLNIICRIMAPSLEIWSLAGLSLAVGGLHTLLGPDHYVPFVAMSRAGGWTTRKTLVVTVLCGLGHVLSSVLLGSVGIALGLAVNRLEGIEAARGGIAGWLLIGFGIVYLAWGLVYGLRGRSHSHPHVHADGTMHTHPHSHDTAHLHPHAPASTTRLGTMTPWILFTIFFFGPCEPLIPLLMYPAAEASLGGVVVVTLVFSLATLATMVAMVGLLVSGVRLVKFPFLERFNHAFAGGLILACGAAIKLGL